MKKHFAHLAYKTNSISTLSPSEMTLRLLNSCLDVLDESKKMIENKDIEGRNRTLQKAQLMIVELINMLDMEEEISKKIFILYEYLYSLLVEANIQKDVNKIIEVEKYILELKNAIKESIKNKHIKTFTTNQV